MVVIRNESHQDSESVYRVVTEAFGRPEEADLVNRLRELEGSVSLVASIENEIVGHILFSRVRLVKGDGHRDDLEIAGLAPMAVSPSHQRSGIGKKLIESGLGECKRRGYQACVLLGHPGYYPRFGFRPAFSSFSIRSTYEVPDEAFMALELVSDSLENKSGTIHYHSSFGGL